MYNVEFQRKINRIAKEVEHLLIEDFSINIGKISINPNDAINHNEIVDYVKEAVENAENIFANIDYPKLYNIKEDKRIIEKLLEIGIIFDVYDGDNYKFSFYDSDDNPLDIDVLMPDEDENNHSIYSTELFMEFLKESCNNHNVLIRINNFNDYQIF